MTQPEPAAALDRIRRAATQWRLAHNEGDLPVAWDEAAITVLALIDNPNVTWTDLGFTRPAITGHAVVQPEPAQTRHTVDSLTDAMLTTLYNERDMLGRESDRLRKGYVEERTRAERAEAALDAVRAECDALEAELYPVADDGMAIATRRIRAALDAHTNPKDQPGT